MLILIGICVIAIAVMTIVYMAVEIADMTSEKRFEQALHLMMARLMIDELGDEEDE